MPRVRRQNVPPALLQHLVDRVQSRKIPASQLELLAKWLDREPKVSEGPWYKRFYGMTVCGAGESIKTVLVPDRAPKGNMFRDKGTGGEDRRRYWRSVRLGEGGFRVTSQFQKTRRNFLSGIAIGPGVLLAGCNRGGETGGAAAPGGPAVSRCASARCWRISPRTIPSAPSDTTAPCPDR